MNFYFSYLPGFLLHGGIEKLSGTLVVSSPTDGMRNRISLFKVTYLLWMEIIWRPMSAGEGPFQIPTVKMMNRSVIGYRKHFCLPNVWCFPVQTCLRSLGPMDGMQIILNGRNNNDHTLPLSCSEAETTLLLPVVPGFYTHSPIEKSNPFLLVHKYVA